MTGRAWARARARARARGGKIINTTLLIPDGAIYTTGAPVLQGGGLNYGRGGAHFNEGLWISGALATLTAAIGC